MTVPEHVPIIRFWALWALPQVLEWSKATFHFAQHDGKVSRRRGSHKALFDKFVDTFCVFLYLLV